MAVLGTGEVSLVADLLMSMNSKDSTTLHIQSTKNCTLSCGHSPLWEGRSVVRSRGILRVSSSSAGAGSPFTQKTCWPLFEVGMSRSTQNYVEAIIGANKNRESSFGELSMRLLLVPVLVLHLNGDNLRVVLLKFQ